MARGRDDTDAVSPATELNNRLSVLSAQAISVAAKLGIADLLSDGPKDLAEIARVTGADHNALSRLLRLLASEGIFAKDARGRFTLTRLAESLRADAPHSVHPRALLVGQVWWRAWGELLHTVRTGEPAFKQAYGMAYNEYIRRNADAAAAYGGTMTLWTTESAKAILAAYDFSQFGTVVDLGGAHGALMAAILSANPTLRGIILDLPTVVHGARNLLDAVGVTERCELVAGSFLEAVPRGGDAYILKWVLGDWDDTDALKILTNCHRAMGGRGKLLMVDPLMPVENEPSSITQLDLILLALHGGRVRTEEEIRGLLTRARFAVTRVVPTSAEAGFSVVEAVPM